VAELFLAPDGTGYADVIVHGHRETWPIRSRGFRRWLARRFFETEHKAVRSEAMQSVIGLVDLVRAGLATAKAERVVAAGRTAVIARVRITEAGRRVLGKPC
jgi:hypothetical protein